MHWKGKWKRKHVLTTLLSLTLLQGSAEGSRLLSWSALPVCTQIPSVQANHNLKTHPEFLLSLTLSVLKLVVLIYFPSQCFLSKLKCQGMLHLFYPINKILTFIVQGYDLSFKNVETFRWSSYWHSTDPPL